MLHSRRVSEYDMGFKMLQGCVQVDMNVYRNCVYPPSNLLWRVSECDMIVYRYRVSECHMIVYRYRVSECDMAACRYRVPECHDNSVDMLTCICIHI